MFSKNLCNLLWRSPTNLPRKMECNSKHAKGKQFHCFIHISEQNKLMCLEDFQMKNTIYLICAQWHRVLRIRKDF